MVAFAPFNDDSCLEKSDHKRWLVFPVQHKRLGFVVIFYRSCLFRFIVFLTFVVTFLLGKLIEDFAIKIPFSVLFRSKSSGF